mmetsp:Transcript_83884/g.259378  ORF Transcript_83884/g.259378 Transcript_83884/m.259378 type:complete len:201 (+) Transcript_83884:1266-1868(+)
MCLTMSCRSPVRPGPRPSGSSESSTAPMSCRSLASRWRCTPSRAAAQRTRRSRCRTGTEASWKASPLTTRSLPRAIRKRAIRSRRHTRLRYMGEGRRQEARMAADPPPPPPGDQGAQGVRGCCTSSGRSGRWRRRRGKMTGRRRRLRNPPQIGAAWAPPCSRDRPAPGAPRPERGGPASWPTSSGRVAVQSLPRPLRGSL